MRLTRLVARMDSGMEFYTTYDKPEVTQQFLKETNAEIEQCCADGFDFVSLGFNLLCISKIESLHIQSREFDDD